jgi:hypothetical protein
MPSCHSRVGSRPAVPAAHHRGKVWEPSEGSHTREIIPAATYSPTEFPLQYHRPWRA